MSPYGPPLPRSPRRRRLPAVLMAGAAAFASWPGGAAAQIVDTLRGAVAESAVNGELLPPRLPASQPFPTAAGTAYETATPEPGFARASAQEFDDDVLGRPSARAPARRRAATDDTATGTVRATTVDGFEDAPGGRMGTEDARVGAAGIAARRAEENPYSPVGLRLGSFTLTSVFDQGIGWTSNASASPRGSSSVYSETGLRLSAVSDWSQHSATIDADARLRRSLSGERIAEPQGGIAATLRTDLGGDFSALSTLAYRLRQESASAPVVIEDTASRPLRHTLEGRTALLKDVGKLRLRLQGEVVREAFGDARLSGGGTLSQRDRNATLATVSARVGYAVSPALTPFVEAEIGRRIYDERLDGAGYERSADRYGVRAGVELDLGEKLRGEVAAGWLAEKPRDARLAELSAPYAAASLAWSPMRGTTVDLRATTTVEGTTAAGETGSVLYGSEVSVTHELRQDLTASALIGFDWRDYAGTGGTDRILRGEARMTWWMNRHLGLTGRASHEIQRSTLDGRNYNASGLYLGLTLQN